MKHQLPISEKRLAFRTWELLSIKMISKFVDELSAHALQFVDSQPHQKPETDAIKRLVQAFLPAFPDDCRLETNLKVIVSYPVIQERNRITNRTIRLTIDPCPGLVVGDSLWIVYGCIFYDDDDVWDESWNLHPSAAGIACVEIRSKQQPQDDDGGMVPGGATEILANIREKLSFDRFYEYFQNTESSNKYCNARDVSYYNENDPDKFNFNPWGINLWRRNDQVLGIDMDAQGYYSDTERMYKQVDGTWCHGLSMFEDSSQKNWGRATVGRSFLSNDLMQDTQNAWMDLTGEIENV